MQQRFLGGTTKKYTNTTFAGKLKENLSQLDYPPVKNSHMNFNLTLMNLIMAKVIFLSLKVENETAKKLISE